MMKLTDSRAQGRGAKGQTSTLMQKYKRVALLALGFCISACGGSSSPSGNTGAGGARSGVGTGGSRGGTITASSGMVTIKQSGVRDPEMVGTSSSSIHVDVVATMPLARPEAEITLSFSLPGLVDGALVAYKSRLVWHFFEGFDELVPVTLTESTTNYGSALFQYDSRTGQEWTCEGVRERDGGPAENPRGSYSATIDTAVFESNAVNGWPYYTVHGKAHASCPGFVRDADQRLTPGPGTVDIDATF
jgi:hypothetical protein